MSGEPLDHVAHSMGLGGAPSVDREKAQARQLDHVVGELQDRHRLAHLQHEHLSALAE